MARHIRKDDQVIVTAGAHKGEQGKVLAVLTKKDAVLIEGVNIHVKNLKKTPAKPEGGQVRTEFPIHWSNVSPAVTVGGKVVPTRVRFETKADGSKLRIAVKTGQPIGAPIKAAKVAAKPAKAPKAKAPKAAKTAK